MFIRLSEPNAKNSACNWLLQAENLRDPAGWNRFVPVHSVDSERYRFEKVARELDPAVKLVVRKNLLEEGLSVFEYDWNLSEDTILEHAMKIAEALQAELVLGQPSKAA